MTPLEQAIDRARKNYEDLAAISEGWRGSCEGCQWRNRQETLIEGRWVHRCLHPLVAPPVAFKASTGEMTYEVVLDSVARSAEGLCGPQGTLWESKYRWKRDLVWLKEQWRRLRGETQA